MEDLLSTLYKLIIHYDSVEINSVLWKVNLRLIDYVFLE